ncbi:MAG: hypothetical protein ACRDLB_10365 [Actinomycetota bacterium]
MKNLAILLTVCLIAAVAGYFAFVSGDEIDEMTLQLDAGRAFVVRDTERIAVEDSLELEEGDLIQSDGVARLRLAGQRHAFLDGKARVEVANDRSLDGQSGSLRAESSRGDVLKVTFGDVSANVNNANFRIDQGVGSTRAGTYEGSVDLSTPGEPDLTIPEYFEATIAVGDLPVAPRPYRFSPSDPWDDQFLGSVITLDQKLTQYGDGLSSNIGGARPSLGYFAGLADRNVDFMRRYLRRATDDLLIAFTIAENAPGHAMKRAFTQAFELRDNGGRWGLVATILDTRPNPLLADLTDLIVATGVVDGNSEGTAEPEFDLAAGAGSAPGEGGGSDPQDPIDNPPDDPSDPRDPKDPKDPDEGDDCSSGLECDISEINPLDDDPSPTPPPEEEEDPPLTDGVLNGGDGLP